MQLRCERASRLPDILRGDTYGPHTFVYRDPVTGGVPDSPLASVRIHLKTDPATASADIDWSTAGGEITVTDDDNWEFTLSAVDAADTSAFTPATHYFDIEGTADDGTVVTVMRGTTDVIRDITI